MRHRTFERRHKNSDRIVGFLASLFWAAAFILLTSPSVLAWDKIDFQKTPGQETFPQSDAVIIKDEAFMDVLAGGEALFTQHVIMKIFSDPGKRYSHQEVPCNNSVEVVSIKARTIHANGDEFFLDQEDIREKSLLSELVLYSDAKVREFYCPRVVRDCLVEYEYQLRFKSLLYWADWFFQSHLPTLYSRYTLMIPKGFEFRVKVLNAHLEPKIDFKNGKQTFGWEAVNTPALRKEVFMPPAADTVPRLAFSALKFRFDGRTFPSVTWDDIARWYWEISEPSTVATQELSLIAAQLTSSSNSKETRIKAIFDYVQERVRYVSIAIGTGAFKPHLCADVLQYGYGDCKDMTSLLIALLRATDIEAFPALLSTRHHRSVLAGMPKVKQFDHVLAVVLTDEGYIWLDPACRNCRFGQLPYENQRATALIIKPDGGELVVTPESSEEENVTRTLWQVKLNSDGSATGEVSIWATGEEELAFRASLTDLKPQRRTKALTGFLSSWFTDPYLAGHHFEHLEDQDSNVLISADFVAGGFGVEDQGRLFLPVNLNTQNYLSIMFPHQERRFPVRFDYRFINQDEMVLEIPVDLEVECLPGAVRLDEPFGLFESTYELDEGRIVRKRTFVRKQLLVQVSEYPRLKEFYDRAAEEDSERIVLKKNSDQD
jgi:hypothetical protein